MNPQALAAQTIAHYERYAVSYRDGTADHDVSQNIDALLGAITGASPFKVLDFGCGPGRDLCSFVQRGHLATGLDGSAPFVAMARLASGCEVWQQDFLALDLPAARFDGVFANATLFHVPRSELPRVLEALHHTLKPGGVLFSSNPRGQDQEGFSGSRYGAYFTLDTWRGLLKAAGFDEISHYYRPTDAPPAEQFWLASLWRRRALPEP
jgi:SAM-dependent methyltransferase